MNTYVMSFRTAAGLRLQPLLARDLAHAWDCAFDLAERLGRVQGFGLRRVGGGR